MKSKIITPRFIFISSAIVIAAVSRLFPHIPNFTPIAAMALFGGVYFNSKISAIIIPLLAMGVSDGTMEFFNGTGYHNTMIYVYGAFVLTTLLGITIRKKVSLLTIGAASIITSLLFFLITNLGVWVQADGLGGWVGLGTTYSLGIPFFGPTLVGDLFFNTILFGAFTSDGILR